MCHIGSYWRAPGVPDKPELPSGRPVVSYGGTDP
jgi:hypothetical protein